PGDEYDLATQTRGTGDHRYRGRLWISDRPACAGRRRRRSRNEPVRLFRPTLRIRMALLYGGLVLLVGVSLLFTSIVLLNHSISQLPLYQKASEGRLTITDQRGRIVFRGDPADLVKTAQSKAVSYLLNTGLIYFGIIVVIGTTGGYLLAKQALRPIAKLTHTAQQLSTETLDQRINL